MTTQTPDAVREALEPLRKLFDAAEGQWPKTPWKVIPSDGKPIIASERGGNLFRGYIATWQEADLIVGIVNALPTILAALDSRAGDAGEGWKRAKAIAEGMADAFDKLAASTKYDAGDRECWAASRDDAREIAELLATPAPAVDAVPAGEVDTYSRWLAGDETLPTLPREQYLRFQASSDRAIKNRRRTPQTVADGVEEVRRNPDDPDWDNCPACKGGALDTGYECNTCGFDAQPLVHLKDACEARGERMHPSGLYESEIAHPFLAALSHGEGR